MTQKDRLAAMMDSRGQIVRLVSSEVHLPKGWAMKRSEK